MSMVTIVYDSLNSRVSQGTEIHLAKKSIKIKIASVNKQAGFDDCGICAAAYCTALENGQDPSTLVYDQAPWENI